MSLETWTAASSAPVFSTTTIARVRSRKVLTRTGPPLWQIVHNRVMDKVRDHLKEQRRRAHHVSRRPVNCQKHTVLLGNVQLELRKHPIEGIRQFSKLVLPVIHVDPVREDTRYLRRVSPL